MKIIHAPSELAAGRPVCLAIGFFDGVHVGHQLIIGEMVRVARAEGSLPAVLTFDNHPATIVSPERAPLLLQTLPQRMRTLSAFGPEAILLLHFDAQFSAQPADEFLRSLVRDLKHVSHVFVGANFHFGHKRTGNVNLLASLQTQLGFVSHGLSPVLLDGQPVSSTRVRDAVRTGCLDLVSRMLNRPYSLCGLVVRGDGLGRQIGFPTANLDVSGLVLLPNGVYSVTARHRGTEHRAVLNIGVRPTLGNPAPQLRVEAHIPGFRGDLYGAELELVFHRKIREEQRFPSLDALRHQIALDISAVKDDLNVYP